MIEEQTAIQKAHTSALEPPFRVMAQDSQTKARLGRLRTGHGEIETPCFMPCGTQGTVKGLSSEELERCGAGILLANAYHLYLRPGEEVFEKTGRLHAFMGWRGAILTDSGGFQLFSLSPLRKVTDEGVFFQSHVDGSRHFLTPEEMVQFQLLLGSDILMVLDECVGYPAEAGRVQSAHQRSLRWAERSKRAFRAFPAHPAPLLFGIVQGGVDPALRRESCERLTEIGFDGYAIGGLGVGEPKPLLWEMGALCASRLPAGSPRYLMGVGPPEDLLEGISAGIDLFDCVLPTRNGRNGELFTRHGTRNLRNSSYARDSRPPEEACLCPVCQRYSRAYLRHLLKAREMLGGVLTSLHNVWFYLSFLRAAREAIRAGTFGRFKETACQALRSVS